MAADRSVLVRLRVDSSGVVSGVSQAERSIKGLEDQVTKTTKKAKTDWDAIGVAAGAVAAAGALAFRQMGSAAIGFESGLADVAKTVDGTADQIASLGGDLRQMASRDVPMSVRGLTDIASAAGQLGIQRENVAGFTNVMADLGVATNLAGTEGATSLARLANITGMAQTDFDRLGATVVDLGNNLATTEAEIVDMGLRLAGAGAQIGLTEAQTLGLAGALSSLGVASEAGGTAISRVMIDIASATASGGEELEQFAQIAGMSSEEFTTAWRDDAGGALATFIEGLGNVAASGGNVFGVLEDIGFADVRVRDSLLRTSGAGDILRASLDRGTRAWEENTALTDEAALRYATTESQIQFAKNAVGDLGIELGEHLLPIITTATTTIRGFSAMVGDLPDPVQKAGVYLGGFATVSAGAGAALALLLPRIQRTGEAVRIFGAGSLATGVSRLGAWGLAIGGAITIMGKLAGSYAEGRQKVEDYTAAIEADTGAIGENTRTKAANALQTADIADEMSALGLSAGQVVDAMLHEADALANLDDILNAAMSATTETGQANFELRDAAQAVAAAVGAEASAIGEASEAERERQRIMADSSDVARKYRELVEMGIPTHTAMAAAQGIVAAATEDVGDAMGEAAGAVDVLSESTEDAAELNEALVETFKNVLSSYNSGPGAIGSYTSALSSANEVGRQHAEATAAATESSTDSWTDYFTEVTASADVFYSSQLDRVGQIEEHGRLMAEAQQRGLDNLLAEIIAAGPEYNELFAEILDGPIERAEDTEMALADAVGASLNNAIIAMDQPGRDLIDAHGNIAEEAVQALAEQTDLSPERIREALDDSIGVARERGVLMQEAFDQMGADSTAALALRLRAGVGEADAIGAEYSNALINQVNPLLVALGGASIPEQARILGVPVGVQRNAGGQIPGSGPDRDSVLVHATPEEWMINRTVSRREGPHKMDLLNRGLATVQPLNAGGMVQGPHLDRLHPEFLRRQTLMAAAQGTPYTFTSGWRSREQQARLYQMYLNGTGNLAAPPGSSNHEFGLATDGLHWGGRNPGAFGLAFPVRGELWHMEPIGARAMRGTAGAAGFTLPDLPEHAFSSMIGEPLDASMTHARDSVQEWLDSQFYFPGMDMTSGLPDSGPTGGSRGANRAAAQQMNAGRGWGSHWGAHDQLVQKESGWNHLAQNPTSTAYGLYQFLNSTWATVGGSKTSDPIEQIRLGMAYIAQRYGDPTAALGFHLRNNWYDDGGWLMPGTTLATNATGQPERVISPNETVDVNITGWSTSAAQDAAAAIFDPGSVPHTSRPATTIEQDAEIARNREMLRIEGLAAAERLLEVETEMADLERRGLMHTDAWVDLLREAERLEADIVREATAHRQEIERQVQARVAAAEAAEREAQAIRNTLDAEADRAAGELDRMLDQRDRLIDSQAKATASYATAVAAAQRKASDDINRLVQARNDALFGAFGQIGSRFEAGWGNTVGQYNDEQERRNELFDEWADGIADLRARGFTDLIDDMGLNDPSRLADVRLFVRSTDAELDRLVDSRARGAEQVASHVDMESDLLLGALGVAITDVRETLDVTLTGLSEDLNVTLTDLGLQMAAIGAESGRTYAERMAEALASGLPAVVAAAEAYEAALARASAAASGINGLGAGGASATTVTTGSGGANVPIPTGGAKDAALSFFDSGGVLSPGLTMAMNATGGNEYVLTPDQLRSLRAAPQPQASWPSEMTLVVDGRPMRAYVQETSRAARAQDARQRRGAGVR